MSGSATAIVARNTTYQFAGKAITIVLSMVTFAIITRTLSVDQYGAFTLISTFFALVIGLTDLRIDQTSVREAAQDPDKLTQLAGQSIIIKTVFSLAIMLIAMGVIWLTNYNQIVKIGSSMVFVGVLFNSLQSGYSVIIQHHLKAYLLTLAEVISKVVATVAIVLVAMPAIMNGQSTDVTVYTYALIMLVLSPLIILVIYRYITSRSFKAYPVWSVNKQQVIYLLQQTWPLWVISLLALVHYRADTIILSIFKDDYAVGIYGVPYRLLDVTVTLPPLLIASVYPIISKYALVDKDRADRALIKTFSMLFIFVMGLAAIIYYAAPQIVAVFGGLEYQPSILVLRILCMAMIGSYLASIFAPYIIAFRHQLLIVFATGSSVVLNIALSLWLIPNLSYNGAAIATATSEFLGFILLACIVLVKYKLKLQWWSLAKVVVAAIITLGVLQLTSLNSYRSDSLFGNALVVVAISAIVGLVYGAQVIAYKIIDKDIIQESVSTLPLPQWLKKLL